MLYPEKLLTSWTKSYWLSCHRAFRLASLPPWPLSTQKHKFLLSTKKNKNGTYIYKILLYTEHIMRMTQIMFLFNHKKLCCKQNREKPIFLTLKTTIKGKYIYLLKDQSKWEDIYFGIVLFPSENLWRNIATWQLLSYFNWISNPTKL